MPIPLEYNPFFRFADKKKKCDMIDERISKKQKQANKKRSELLTLKKNCSSKTNQTQSTYSLVSTINRLNKLLKMYDENFDENCKFNIQLSNNIHTQDDLAKELEKINKTLKDYIECFNHYYDKNYLNL